MAKLSHGEQQLRGSLAAPHMLGVAVQRGHSSAQGEVKLNRTVPAIGYGPWTGGIGDVACVGQMKAGLTDVSLKGRRCLGHPLSEATPPCATQAQHRQLLCSQQTTTDGNSH